MAGVKLAPAQSPFANAGFQALAPQVVAIDATGAFTAASQRFAYDSANGAIFYDAFGSGDGGISAKLVATLAHSPALSAANFFFTL